MSIKARAIGLVMAKFGLNMSIYQSTIFPQAQPADKIIERNTRKGSGTRREQLPETFLFPFRLFRGLMPFSLSFAKYTTAFQKTGDTVLIIMLEKKAVSVYNSHICPY
ncbi:MAG: hypothetical protein WC421_09460 [Elusimicrobiales bacterium]